MNNKGFDSDEVVAKSFKKTTNDAVLDVEHHAGIKEPHDKKSTAVDNDTNYETVDLSSTSAKVNDIDKVKEKIEIVEEVDEISAMVHTKPYADMGKDDLLRFSDTPFWNRFRLISILLFWGIWLAMLGAVIGLTIVAPRCDDAPTPDWWQKSVIYQIYIRSFYDNDANGVGDLAGVAAKLDYVKELKADAILLSSVFQSSRANTNPDYGYEVTNYEAVDVDYGTSYDLDNLIEEAHDRGIAVLLDFVPNHTGSDHPWFVESRQDSSYTNPRWNYYVWAKCGVNGTTLPNNWLTVYGQPAWTYEGVRGECYLHQFLDTQPELNLRSRAVQDELEAVLRFWLDKGVDGFRINSVAYLFESQDLGNETRTSPCTEANVYNCLLHTLTKSQPEVYDLVARWRAVLNNYTTNGKRVRILLTDGDVEVPEVFNYYGTFGRDAAHIPINYALSKIGSQCNGRCIESAVRQWMGGLPLAATANWMTGDQDRSRLWTEVGGDLTDAVMLLKITLPGAALVYYGEEIGLADFRHSLPIRDPVGHIDPSLSRDPYRTPMQWTNNTDHGGFVNDSITPSSSPWLPINTTHLDYWNVMYQNETENTIFKRFKALSKLHSEEGSFQFGQLHYLAVDDQIFSFVREHEGFFRFLVAINFGTSSFDLDMTSGSYSISVPDSAIVVFTTDSTMEAKIDDDLDLRHVILNRGQGIIVKWAYERP